MGQELRTLYSRYAELVRRGSGDEAKGGTEHHNSQLVWGEQLSFDQFQDRWKRICKDPALMRYWQTKLSTVLMPADDEAAAA